MKQKVEMQICMFSEKCRKKAMKIAVGVPGVESAAFQGAEKNQILVIGDGIDVVGLAKLIRKRVGFAQLLSVSPIEEKKKKS